MKRMVCGLMVLGLVAAFGCAKKGPEDAAKSYLEKQIAAKHKGIHMDTSGLSYKVIEETEDSAKVKVSGTIKVEAEIPLVKKAGTWVIGEKKAASHKKAPASGAHAPAAHQETKETKEPAHGSTHMSSKGHEKPAEHGAHGS